MQKYNHHQIEQRWQDYWQAKKIFTAKDFSKKPKKYILVEFPYPSGEGLHMGHLRPYTAGDVHSRFLRLKGFEVMYPMGWDAFGLPAENYAIRNKVHPIVSTAKNIKNAKKQLQAWGMSFDWNREINTTDPEYYKWTQWIFLQFFKKGLAYESTGVINWCPKDKTGLANEEVIDGCCERCGAKVEKKELRQWYLRITAYAEKLLEGLKSLNKWPEAIKLQQENWIGKSMGAEIEFPVSANYNYVLLHGFNGRSNGVFFPWLKRELERRGLKYYAPDLPNSGSPTEEEQVGFVLDSAKFDENTVLLGHSLGCVVAMKVLEKLKTKIAGLVLAGGFVEHNFKDRPRPFEKTFKWKFNFDKIRENTGFVTVLSDVYDYAIPAEQGRILAKELKGALIYQEAQKPHFTNTQEPLILENLVPSIKVFTTRPDTIFGATYMVLAPEHPIIQNSESRIQNLEEVKKYIEKAKNETDINRTAVGREKTGVELKGIKAVNPATKEEIPIWVADYVLWGYGTGAIMAVPAHDERDFEFAKKFNLPIKAVVYDPHLSPPHEGEREGVKVAYIDKGILINSGKFTGMKSEEAIPKMAQEFGRLAVQYKLRDWVFSRQRYWGEPIPLIHCEDCGVVPVPDKDLPVTLPKVKKYEPTGTGESPLASIKSWVKVKCPKCEKLAWRETNTMPQWAGSSWYWLRYADSKNKKEFASKKKLKYWQPVDVYFGGMEHTTLHLLYSRFWNLFLYDQGLVTQKEPYVKRQPHGIVLAQDGEKMSKSRGNVVNPDDIVKKFGADTLRMYELFLGPHELAVSWNDQGAIGVRRFLDRVWAWANKVASSKNPAVAKALVGRQVSSVSEKAEKLLHRLIKKVTEDIENFRFNTAVSAFMEFHNQIKNEPVDKKFIKTFLILLYPFAPHLAEELHQILGGKRSLQLEKWPEYNLALVIDKEVEIVVQINGKVRGKVQIPVGSSEEQVKTKVLELDLVKKTLVQESIKRVVFVPDKLINLVI